MQQQSNPPICWTIAGSDSGGGAGIQADLKTFHALGVYGCTVISALTAQNTQGVIASESVSTTMLQQQLQALKADLLPRALKIGMLASPESVEIIASEITARNVHDAFKTYDPVMIATSGDRLMPDNVLSVVKNKLFPVIDFLTPNLHEAEAITGLKNASIEEMAEAILKLGVKAVLIKGGHNTDNAVATDYYQDADSHFYLSNSWIDTKNTHGTGCTLSAAITAAIALGYSVSDAIVIAKAYVHQGLRLASSQVLGSGPSPHGPLVHAGWPESQVDLPELSNQNINATNTKIIIGGLGGERSEPPNRLITPPPPKGEGDKGGGGLNRNIKNPKPGFYAVVPDVSWVEKLLPFNLPMIQLRFKSNDAAEIEAQVSKAIELTRNSQTKLFINDHWEMAIKYQAYGVHLGQSDLDTADIAAIKNAGLKLGLSTHCYTEVARAHATQPSYIAIGPVFETTTKQMPFQPQGLDNLSRWVRTLSDYPLVAIGGIFKDSNAKAVWDTGVSAIAVVRDITECADLEQHLAEWQKLLA